MAIRRGAIIAFGAGLAFPLLGTAIEAARHDAVTLATFWEAQATTPLLWILNVVPIVLGFAGHMAEGAFRTAAVPISREGRRLTQHLILLALLSALLLMYALQQFAGATRMTQDMNLAGALRAETVTAYQIAAHPETVSGGVTVRSQIERIASARARLRDRVPGFLAETDHEWCSFRDALLKPGGADWAATERLSAGADVLAANIEVEATRRNNQASVVLALGIFSLAVALLKGFDLARQLQNAEEDLRLSQARLAEAQQIARLGSWEYNPASHHLVWSDEVFRIFGASQARGQTVYPYEDFVAAIHEDDRARLENAFAATIRGEIGVCALDYRVRLKKGVIRYVHTAGQAVRDPRTGTITRLVGTIQDVTERKRAEQELQVANALLHELATTDGLTGLHNHRLLHERLESETARAHRYNAPLSLVMLDVDNFKAFNDAHGHPAGDEVLKEIAVRISALARACDVVARYGGEEFAILLPETDGDGARAFAERCRLSIKDGEWPVAPLTASLGVATLSAPAMTHTQLLEAADKALYRSKREGRNRVTEAAPFTAPAPVLPAPPFVSNDRDGASPSAPLTFSAGKSPRACHPSRAAPR